jgi:putative methionine-R-sulfoxide reductase with GAF domain
MGEQEGMPVDVKEFLRTLQIILESPASRTPVSQQELDAIYKYDVPIITEEHNTGEVCSKFKAKDPFNLATRVLNLSYNLETLQHHPQTERLVKLQDFVGALHKEVGCDWIGIYRAIANLQFDEKTLYASVLIKEAYRGSFSRADFPITEEFAKRSTNSLVALTGQTKIIDDVNSHGGPYYQCDVQVNSEICAPISHNGKVIGIIDAEAFQPGFFKENNRILKITEACKLLGDWSLGV